MAGIRSFSGLVRHEGWQQVIFFLMFKIIMGQGNKPSGKMLPPRVEELEDHRLVYLQGHRGNNKEQSCKSSEEVSEKSRLALESAYLGLFPGSTTCVTLR